jgi:hypothetical protein
MKPQRFKPGQKVTMSEKKPWVRVSGTNINLKKPVFGEIYTIDFYSESFLGQWYVVLDEFGPGAEWCEERFAPLVSDEVLEKALSEVNQLEYETH